MPRRQRKSDFDHLVEALARLPWQACLALAPIAWLGFHQLALIEPPVARNVGEMGNSVGVIVFKTTGLFLQYLAPLALLLAALMSGLAPILFRYASPESADSSDGAERPDAAR